MIVQGLTDIGLIRENNQDSYFISKDIEFPLFVVADGMGGHKAGNIASSMAINIIKNSFKYNKDLKTEEDVISTIKESIEKANHEIYKESLINNKYSGMGTTVTLAYLLNNKIYIGHVGDSRAYYINKKNIEQITEDHSLVYELIKDGSITIAQGENHPKKNTITRAVGTSDKLQVDIYIKKYEKDHKLLIASDGLTDMVKDEEIFKIISGNNNVVKKSKDMVKVAKNKGGLDNITIILVKL